MAAAGGGGDTTEDVVKQMKKLQGTLKEIAALKQRKDGGEALPHDAILKIGRESELLKNLRALEAKPGAADALKAAAGPKWTYFYVLPATFDFNWHDVYQQRLDRDAGAAAHIEAAIRLKLKTEYKLPDKGLRIEVATARVDLFNEAYKFNAGERMARAKEYVGDGSVHAWRPENKRFLVRISESHSKELLSAFLSSHCPTITVLDVPQLPVFPMADRGLKQNHGALSPNGFDFATYEHFCNKNPRKVANPALDANRRNGIVLSLVSPLIFGVQASLAPKYLPSGLLDLSTLGTAFLDIIMPFKFQEHKTHSNPSFLNALLYLMRNCVAHFREVQDGRQAFGVNTKAREEKALLRAAIEWCYKGTWMEGGGLAQFTQPSDRPSSNSSFWPPDSKQIWWTDKSKAVPARALTLGGQEPFDILDFLFHSSSSAFSHVLPLCFKALRLSMRKGALLQPPVKLMQFNFRLDCMPAAPFDMEKKSMLDWYFDCEGEQCSLRGWLMQAQALVPAAGGGAAAGGAIAAKPKKSSELKSTSKPTASAAATAAAPPPPKPERHTRADAKDAPPSIFHHFQGHLQVFREKIQKLAAFPIERSQDPDSGDAAAVDGFDETFVWIRANEYGLDSATNPNVWLGLGRLEDGFRKPVAIKKNDEADDKLRLKRVMRKLKPGSFIASAELVELEPLHTEESQPPATAPPQTPKTPKDKQLQQRWVSEAGVCTLEQLFAHPFPPSYDEERCTKAHRMLVREVLHSMALAVFHLHECKIAHGTINLRYFKVFLIEEPPRSTNLRVKLVSMRWADTLNPAREAADIHALGHAMVRVVLGAQSSDVEQLLSYDPSLYLLIKWILQTDGDGATLADVIRHPYFMSLNEKEAFTLALEGGVFGQIASTAELESALAPLATAKLQPFIDSLFQQLRAESP